MEKLAIIKGVGIGMRDYHTPIMWFETRTSEGSGALQILSWASAEEVIRTTQVYDVRQLEGWPCWVDEGDGIITFLRAWERRG